MIKLKSLIEEILQLDKDEFRSWFDGSKVVDNHGSPLVVFHGTRSPPNKFLHKRKGFSSTIFGSYETDRYGIFAAEDPKLAQNYMNAGSDEKFNDGSIIPLYMRIENPLDTTKSYSDALFNTIIKYADEMGLDGYRIARIFGDKWGRGYLWTIFDADEYNDPEIWIKLFKSMGYDGLKLHESVDGGDIRSETWVAFDPEQVRSAILINRY
jgi:hypothetical protein